MIRMERANTALQRQKFEDPNMDLQLALIFSNGKDDSADHTRLEQLFSRHVQKADTYHRISLTAEPRLTGSLGDQP